MQPTVAISQDFLGAFAQIPKGPQKQVMEFVTKFRANPFSSGINYEKINDARDANFRSVRMGQDYRGIVLKPDNGDVYVLLWVDKHDAAYDWARRHRCTIHPETGSVQLLETLHALEDEAPALPHATSPSAAPTPLFALRARELARLGVPEERIDAVLALTHEAELEAMESRLPKEAFEALYLMAAGLSFAEVEREYGAPDATSVDTSDFATALRRDHSQRHFVVVDAEQDLQAILEAPLEKWRVFLHPSQRRLVQWNVAGPVRVLGGAGTGKTVVAMHRAGWLVRHQLKEHGSKILLTTFTANLATDIQSHLRRICTPEELERIEVTHIDAWVARFLKSQGYPHQIVYDNDERYRRCWELALDNKPAALNLPDSFYREEWERIILPQRVTDRQQYFRAKRTGRGVTLNRMQRAAIWPVFEEMRIGLHQQGLRTSDDATSDAADLLDGRNVYLPYAAVVVDEGQDMGQQVMTLIRKLVPAGPNDLFIVGDGHQRIYRRRFALSQCGIEVRGRSRKLRINYRTTEETRRFAVALLEGQPIDDLDGGDDSADGYRSLLHGNTPVLEGFPDSQSEAHWVVATIQALLVNETGAGQTALTTADIGIVARTHAQLSDCEQALTSAGLPLLKLSRSQADDRSRAGIRLATMHRIKGLEFRYVFIVGVNDGVVPLHNAIAHTEDETERRASELNERALLHVAATRAIRGLWVTWNGRGSPFLE